MVILIGQGGLPFVSSSRLVARGERLRVCIENIYKSETQVCIEIIYKPEVETFSKSLNRGSVRDALVQIHVSHCREEYLGTIL